MTGIDASVHSPATFVTIAILAFIAGLARGFSGFGAAMVFIPLASAILTPIVAVPVLLITDIATSWALLPKALKACSLREIRSILIGALVGFPIGLEILTRGSPITVRWIASTIILASLVVIASGWRYRGRPGPGASFCVGLMSGSMSGIAQVGNPPVVAYWLGCEMPTTRLRANLIVYFQIIILVGLTIFAFKGLMGWGVLTLAAATIPGYGIGLWLGSRLFFLASPKIFRTIAIVLILAATMSGLPLFDGILR